MNTILNIIPLPVRVVPFDHPVWHHHDPGTVCRHVQALESVIEA
jgi:hypothetical protein